MRAGAVLGHAAGIAGPPRQVGAVFVPVSVVPERFGTRAQILQTVAGAARGVVPEFVQGAHEGIDLVLDFGTRGGCVAESRHVRPPLQSM